MRGQALPVLPELVRRDMSFSDHDPVNHMNVRALQMGGGEEYFWECESCGGDSYRRGVTVLRGDHLDGIDGLGMLMDDWRVHLRKAHPHVLEWSKSR